MQANNTVNELFKENKIQLYKYRNQTDFIKQFMNRATSHLANIKELSKNGIKWYKNKK